MSGCQGEGVALSSPARAQISEAATRRNENGFFLIVALAWGVLFLGPYGRGPLEMDGMVYSALAKHMSESGNWRVPHYTHSAYDSYYQHPPLFLWLQASAFRLFGVSDRSARILPAMFALSTLTALFLWAGPWSGLLAGLFLLSSRVFVRFASDPFLDGPLAFWLVLGSFCFRRLERESLSVPALVGLAVGAAAAFLTKGLVALALPVSCGVYVCFSGQRRRLCARAMLAFGAALVPIVAWIAFAGGARYLRFYWEQSVSGRLTASSATDHFSPLVELVRSHWPWLPIYLWGLVRAWRGPMRLAIIESCVILAGFALTGHMYNYYLVPFFPFAALVAAGAFPLPAAATRRYAAAALGVLVLAGAVLSFWLPFRVRPQSNDPIRLAAPEAARRCEAGHVREVLISDGLAGRWLGLATVLWSTPWEATSVHLPIEASGNDQVLLSSPSEMPGSGWRDLSLDHAAPFRISTPIGASLCR